MCGLAEAGSVFSSLKVPKARCWQLGPGLCSLREETAVVSVMLLLFDGLSNCEAGQALLSVNWVEVLLFSLQRET